MKKTRAVALTALFAGAAVVMAACSSPGQSGTTTSAATTAATSADTSAAGTDTSAAPTSGGETTGSETPPSGGGGACGTPHGPYDEPAAAPSGAVTAGLNELSTSQNNNTSHSNSVYNNYPLYLSRAQLNYYDADLNLINNDNYITCEKVSDDPLTMKYTINSGAKWSDGVPVTAYDLLLDWIAQGGHFNDSTAETDPDTGELLPSTGVAFDASSTSLALIEDFPEVSDDGLEITFVYSEPFVDAPLGIGNPSVPAHVVGQKALGVTDPTEAVEAIAKAAQDDDKAALKKIADFWNTGFDFTSLPSDKSLYLSNGAYVLTAFQEDQFMTFEPNPDYTWGPKPQVQTITIQYAPDPTAAVQSLANGELQIIEPQATEDVLKGIQALQGQGVETLQGDGGTYEHVDLVFTNGGPFDPKTYGGDEAKALAVRTAFLTAIPRQEIIDRLIIPLNENAQVRNSYNAVPGSPNYQALVDSNGMAETFTGDAEAAKKILADAGVDTSTPIKVRFMYADNNPRRANEYKLIAENAAKAGFDVIDGKNPDWSSQLPNIEKYDASLFGWQSTSTGVSQVPPNFLGQIDGEWVGQNNFGQYNNDEVNDWLNELNVTTDPDKQLELLKNTEAQLVKDGFGTVIFQHPAVTGVDTTKVTGVKQLSLAPTYFWNFWEWQATS